MRSIFETISALDAEGFASFFAPDGSFGSFAFGTRPVVTGRTNIQASVQKFFESITALSYDILSIARTTWSGSKLLVSVEANASYTRLDGSQVTIPTVSVLRFNASCQIQDYQIYEDLAPLLM